MEIRLCGDGDVQAVGAFYDTVVAWLDANGVNYPKWTYGEYPSERSARACIAQGTQYACVDGAQIVGAFVLNDAPEANYQKGDWTKPLADGEYMVLHAFAIDPAHYGQGLGTAVVRFAAKTAQERGYKALRLDTVPDNLPACRLYEKLGFRYAGTYDLDRGLAHIPLFSLFELNW